MGSRCLTTAWHAVDVGFCCSYSLMRLDRPVGIFLLLWPTRWALWIAGAGRPDAGLVVVLVLGVTLVRSGGCVINDYAD